MVVCATVCCAGAVMAQGQKTLTRDQCFKKVGESAKDKAVLAATLEQVELGDCVEFTKRTLKAITRMPIGPKAKAERYVESSILCVDRAREEDVQLGVIAETVAIAPVPDLPGLVKELSKRIDQKQNNLTVEKFRQFAEKGIKTCVDRNAQGDDIRVRNTFAVLLFTRAAPEIPDLQDALLALLPDESNRKLATTWLAAAAEDDYTAILAAAEVPVGPPMPTINMVGFPQTERLLTYLSISDSAFDALLVAGTGSGIWSDYQVVDGGIQQTPLPVVGYQNQGTSLTRAWWCGCRDRTTRF